jgi:anti-sigma factor RsiW
MADRPLACEMWQEDLAGWLVAQISPERERALRAHLDGCAACRAEAASLQAVAAVSLAVDPVGGSSAGPPEPAPEELGERIAAAFAAERGSRRRRRVAAVGVAAAALLAVALAAALVSRDDDRELAGDEIEVTVLPPGATAEVAVAPDDGGSVVELVATGLDPSVTYALWLSPRGGDWDDRVPAGTFRPDADGAVEVRLASAMPAEDAGRVWATTPEGEVALDTE